MDKAINNLLNPLGHLKNEILVRIKLYYNRMLACCLVTVNWDWPSACRLKMVN